MSNYNDSSVIVITTKYFICMPCYNFTSSKEVLERIYDTYFPPNYMVKLPGIIN